MSMHNVYYVIYVYMCLLPFARIYYLLRNILQNLEHIVIICH